MITTVYTNIARSLRKRKHRWNDLSAYNLFIIRTFRQFQAKAWLRYDKTFRQHAAATNLVDWSHINVQLFNFHTAGANVRSSATGVEAQGNIGATVICTSWNRGQCICIARRVSAVLNMFVLDALHNIESCTASSIRDRSPEPKRKIR